MSRDGISATGVGPTAALVGAAGLGEAPGQGLAPGPARVRAVSSAPEARRPDLAPEARAPFYYCMNHLLPLAVRHVCTDMGKPAPCHGGGGTSASRTTELQHGAQQTASNWLHSYLKKQMTASKRRGAWFRLEKRERSMFSLALRLNASFRGYDLLKAMVGVLKKLMEAPGMACCQLTRGVRMAWALSEKCAQWGNLRAKEWRNDAGYAKYLSSHMCGGAAF